MDGLGPLLQEAGSRRHSTKQGMVLSLERKVNGASPFSRFLPTMLYLFPAYTTLVASCLFTGGRAAPVGDTSKYLGRSLPQIREDLTYISLSLSKLNSSVQSFSGTRDEALVSFIQRIPPHSPRLHLAWLSRESVMTSSDWLPRLSRAPAMFRFVIV